MRSYEGGVSLGQLIEALDAIKGKRLLYGLVSPHSYRGYYECLSFAPTGDRAVADVLKEARAASGETFEGYKGGSFKMTLDTECYVADYGNTGWPLTPELLALIVGTATWPRP